MDLYLIRHGQPDWAPGMIARNDPNLTDLGQEQAARVGHRLGGLEDVDEVWVSPMNRALETSNPVMSELGRERGVYDWLKEIQNPPTLEGEPIEVIRGDVTGLPIEGALVSLEPGGLSTTSDAQGQYHFAVAPGTVSITIEAAGMTSVERTVAIEPGAGTVAIDARLTPLGEATSVDSTGGALQANLQRRLRPAPAAAAPAPPTLTLTVPPGAVGGPASFSLTPLSAQGLKALLPLGYSPVAAFHVEGTATPSSPTATLTGLSAIPLHLARWDTADHVWRLAASPAPSGDTLAITLSGLGDFALVAADSGPNGPVLPALGEPLEGARVLEVDLVAGVELGPERRLRLARLQVAGRVVVVVEAAFEEELPHAPHARWPRAEPALAVRAPELRPPQQPDLGIEVVADIQMFHLQPGAFRVPAVGAAVARVVV